MLYKITFKQKSIKDLKKLSNERNRILDKIELLSDNLNGDIKRLTNFNPLSCAVSRDTA